MFFIDATKSYAENIIKILSTYFFKILITVFICYFALGLFLDVETVATASVNAKALGEGMSQARDAAMKDAKAFSDQRVANGGAPLTEKQIASIGAQASRKQFFDSIKQGMKDKIFSAGTGQHSVREREDGEALTLGQQFYDDKGNLHTATAKDVADSQQRLSQSISGATQQRLQDGFKNHDDLQKLGLPPDDSLDFLKSLFK